MVPRRRGPTSVLGSGVPSSEQQNEEPGPRPGESGRQGSHHVLSSSISLYPVTQRCVVYYGRRARNRVIRVPAHPSCGGARSRLSLRATMKFGIAYANAGPFGFPEPLAHLARTAEEVGIGWLKEEFDALGIPFAERAGRTREAVRAIRSLWKETPEPFAGKFFRWGPLESNPKPVQKPGVPIVVGGHGEWAARRAARYGDGFFPAVGEPEKLRALFGVLREECRRIGRKPEEIELSAGRGRPDLDAVRRLQDLGVSRITMGPPGFDNEAVTRGLHDFAERVIAKL